jgi:hypothetical protein
VVRRPPIERGGLVCLILALILMTNALISMVLLYLNAGTNVLTPHRTYITHASSAPVQYR